MRVPARTTVTAVAAVALQLLAACAATPAPVTDTSGASSGAAASSAVRPGVEMFLADVPAAAPRQARRAASRTPPAVDRAGTPDIDLIARHPQLKLVALLAPEHGIRGTVADGAEIDDEVDAKTGVPVYSLYKAEDSAPTPEMLKDVDVLVYDLLEVGGRTWTYVSTMALSMQAAKQKGIPFVVLDRPNPIGGEIVEGALIEPGFTSFVGMYPIPARHGMTVGELAKLFNEKHGIGADLIVDQGGELEALAVDGRDGAAVDEPVAEPALARGAERAIRARVYFEGTNADGGARHRPPVRAGRRAVARTRAKIARAMNARRAARRALRGDHDAGAAERRESIRGRRSRRSASSITDRQAYRPVRTSLAADRRDPPPPPDRLRVDRVARPPHGLGQGAPAIEGGALPALLDEWDREAAQWLETRKPYLLYP